MLLMVLCSSEIYNNIIYKSSSRLKLGEWYRFLGEQYEKLGEWYFSGLIPVFFRGELCVKLL